MIDDVEADRVQSFRDDLLTRAVAGDPVGMCAQLDRATAMFSLGTCIDGVLLPALREVGSRWQAGIVDVETERLTTETVRAWLERLTALAPEPSPAPPLLLACGPGDQHSVGLEALAVLLRYDRRRCRILGARASPRALTIAVKASEPSAVVVVSHLATMRVHAVQSLQAMVGLGPVLFYAGRSFDGVRARVDLPGTYLGTNLHDACGLILAAVDGRAR
ncbi:MAG: B12-binding domain-containing protein [Actinomycetota bacterium]